MPGKSSSLQVILINSDSTNFYDYETTKVLSVLVDDQCKALVGLNSFFHLNYFRQHSNFVKVGKNTQSNINQLITKIIFMLICKMVNIRNYSKIWVFM